MARWRLLGVMRDLSPHHYEDEPPPDGWLPVLAYGLAIGACLVVGLMLLLFWR